MKKLFENIATLLAVIFGIIVVVGGAIIGAILDWFWLIVLILLVVYFIKWIVAIIILFVILGILGAVWHYLKEKFNN
jgi:hypothetical protein